jgi:hypothetical protein
MNRHANHIHIVSVLIVTLNDIIGIEETLSNTDSQVPKLYEKLKCCEQLAAHCQIVRTLSFYSARVNGNRNNFVFFLRLLQHFNIKRHASLRFETNT